jgi:hypothetical protein
MKQTLILIALWCFSFCAIAQIEDNAIPDQLIVHLHGVIKADEFFASYPEAKIMQCLSKNMNIWLVHSSDTKLLSSFKNDKAVIAAQYNHGNVTRRSLVPNDSLFANQWNMLNTSHPGADISATEAWQVNHSAVTQTGDSIVIAVIDGGFDIYHEDLNFFINHNEIPYNGIDDDGNGYIDDYHGWNVFIPNDSVYDLSDVHSTHVSGIAAAIGNNNKGVAGVCWGAKILAIDGASTIESDVIKAYDYVINMRKLYDQTSGAKGAFIVSSNSSFGIDQGQPSQHPIWCAMYDSMGSYGILSACATANNDYNVDVVGDMPTGCPSKWMIAVTNTTQTDILNSSAAYGPVNIDIGAPGSYIESTYPGNSYGLLTGTSMATPHVAGAVAAMIANACPRLIQDYFAYPDSIALVIRDYMFGSVDPLPALNNITTTGGRLNLYHAYIAENAYNCNNCNYNIALQSQQNVSCYGDSTGAISLAVTGSSGFHYLWSTGSTYQHLSGLASGFYELTVTDTAGCQRYFSTTITQPSPILITDISIVGLTSGSSANIIFTVSSGNDTLSYSVDGGSFQSSAIFTFDTPGVHQFRIRNQEGCEIDTTVGAFYTGIMEASSLSSIRLSPNPSSGIAELSLHSNVSCDARVTLTDLTGRTVYSDPMQIINGDQKKKLNLASLSDGVYMLTIAAEGQSLSSVKVSLIR